MPVGQPPKINDELIEKICECLSLGMTITDSCATVGICNDTYYVWKGLGLKTPDSIHGKFLSKIKEALANGQKELVKKIKQDDSWQSAAWILERRYTKTWGRKDVLSVKAIPYRQKVKTETTIDTSNLSVEDLEKLKELYDKANRINSEKTPLLNDPILSGEIIEENNQDGDNDGTDTTDQEG
jgi:hypothetical protein